MSNRIQKVFGNIKAEETLKTQTAAFLCEKIRANNKSSYKNPVRRYSLAFATLLLVFFVGRYSYGLYFTTSAFVDIDVNPAIELSINRFDSVIGTYAYNSDGEEIISDLNLTHKKYDVAMSLIVDKMISEGYIIDDGLVSVTVQSSDNDKETVLLGSLQNSVSVTLRSHHSATEIEVYSVDSDTRTHAHDLNITPAKYLAILELQKANPTIIIEECAGHSISELRELTTEHSDEHHGNDVNDSYNDNSDDTKGGLVPKSNNALDEHVEQDENIENEHTSKTPSFDQKIDDSKHGNGHH